MQYPDYDYETRADNAPWATAPEHGTFTNYDSQLMPLTPNPLTTAPTANNTDAVTLATVLQSMQQTQLQQMYVLRGMETRLTQLEQSAMNARVAQSQAASDSFERTTWWALWGLLMLILGGALAVVAMLILLNAQIM